MPQLFLCSTVHGVWVGLPGGSDRKESACNRGDTGSTLGSGRPPGEGKGYPLWHSCLENPMDRGAWQATVHGVAKSRTRQRDCHFHCSWHLGSFQFGALVKVTAVNSSCHIF